jgi:hypothetical protein
MIQKVLIFTFAVFIAYGCATSKKAVDISVGEWEYVLKNLPDGDADGSFTITKEGDKFAGALHTDQGDAVLDNVVIENDELVCTFEFMEYTVDMTGKFEGDSFNGKCSVEYNDFPMTAVRKQ